MQERYNIIEEIGRGCYGTVYKAIDPNTGQVVAIKQVKVFDKRQGLPEAFFREVSQLKLLHDKNIIKLLNVFVDNERNTYLVLEYCDTDLEKILRSSRPPVGLPVNLVKNYFRQIVTALKICHDHNILHRDLKPSNILISSNNDVKLADFGLSTNLSNSPKNKTIKVSTPGYRAPELLLGDKNYGFPSDVWSLGVILFQMITGLQLFIPANSSDIAQLTSIVNILGKPNEEDYPQINTLPNAQILQSINDCESQLLQILQEALTDDFVDAIPLIEGILRFNPEERLTLDDILNSPFLAEDETMSINTNKIQIMEYMPVQEYSSPSCSEYSSAESMPLDVIRPQRIQIPIYA